jgi:hypothetical protein
VSVTYEVSLALFCDSRVSKSCRSSFVTTQHPDRAAARSSAMGAGWAVGIALCPSCLSAEAELDHGGRE